MTIAPTRIQARLLQVLQNETVAATEALRTADEHYRRTGARPGQAWFDDHEQRMLLRHALEGAAHAAGIPQAWLDHVRERGDRGVRWRADLSLREPEQPDWDTVLGDLVADVARIRDWSALAALHPHTPDTAEADPRTRLARNLNALVTRTAGVVNLLGIDDTIAADLWGTHADLVDTGARQLTGIDATELQRRLHVAASSDTSTYLLQAQVLEVTRIPTNTAPGLPPPLQLGTDILTALGTDAPQPAPHTTPTADLGNTAGPPERRPESPIFRAAIHSDTTELASPSSSGPAGVPPFSDAPSAHRGTAIDAAVTAAAPDAEAALWFSHADDPTHLPKPHPDAGQEMAP
ncbi:hypothetical protein [Nocardia cyriacigeorgica]|uniref:Uncharacterized protein n=1 Tax=Nocardia cyriacigeorgica TaxID=135487 RepID=A0A4U8VST9_9NOCA|nr:hypothetical protein [Nocardia cyriacigeorgica]VFA96282.1 Uncharacterised protein [Nocardia cyriacigeorgica]